VFEYAAASMGHAGIDGEVVKSVWDVVCPGLLQLFDAPLSLPALAPKPILVANGEIDPRCPAGKKK